MALAKAKPNTKKPVVENQPAVEIEKCPFVVNTTPCDLQTLRIGTLDTIPSFDEYKCPKGHRTYHRSENEKLKSAENIEKRMDELAHKYIENHDKESIEELYKLAVNLRRWKQPNQPPKAQTPTTNNNYHKPRTVEDLTQRNVETILQLDETCRSQSCQIRLYR